MQPLIIHISSGADRSSEGNIQSLLYALLNLLGLRSIETALIDCPEHNSRSILDLKLKTFR